MTRTRTKVSCHWRGWVLWPRLHDGADPGRLLGDTAALRDLHADGPAIVVADGAGPDGGALDAALGVAARVLGDDPVVLAAHEAFDGMDPVRVQDGERERSGGDDHGEPGHGGLPVNPGACARRDARRKERPKDSTRRGPGRGTSGGAGPPTSRSPQPSRRRRW